MFQIQPAGSRGPAAVNLSKRVWRIVCGLACVWPRVPSQQKSLPFPLCGWSNWSLESSSRGARKVWNWGSSSVYQPQTLSTYSWLWSPDFLLPPPTPHQGCFPVIHLCNTKAPALTSCFLLPVPLALDQYVILFVTLHLFIIDTLSLTGQKPQKGKAFALLTAVSPPHRLVPTVYKICPVNTAGWRNKLIEVDEAEISHGRPYHCLSSFFEDLCLLRTEELKLLTRWTRFST